MSQDTTPTVSRYANERLEALYARVTHLETAIEAAAIQSAPLKGEQADQLRYSLTAALVDSFRSAMLCLSETTDEQLDDWLPEIEKHEAKQAATS